MVLEIQIIGIIFALVMSYFSFLQLKRKEITGFEFLFWIICWVTIAVIGLFPSILDPLVETFAFARALDLVIVVGFLFLIMITYFNYSAIKKIKKKQETIIREVAFKKAKSKQ
ncbi:MAG: DUF2304 domain-containing protein [Candidatus Woesearchaeota archaeon]